MSSSSLAIETFSRHERRFQMPRYEFRCETCNKTFTLDLKVSEYEKKKYRCPKCNGAKVKQQVTAFQTITSKKS